jgi:hypothetical protein
MRFFLEKNKEKIYRSIVHKQRTMHMVIWILNRIVSHKNDKSIGNNQFYLL